MVFCPPYSHTTFQTTGLQNHHFVMTRSRRDCVCLTLHKPTCAPFEAPKLATIRQAITMPRREVLLYNDLRTVVVCRVANCRKKVVTVDNTLSPVTFQFWVCGGGFLAVGLDHHEAIGRVIGCLCMLCSSAPICRGGDFSSVCQVVELRFSAVPASRAHTYSCPFAHRLVRWLLPRSSLDSGRFPRGRRF